MSDRTSLKIDSRVYDRLAQAKGSTDTWDEFLSRLLNSVEEGQVHFDRATLEDFGEEDDETPSVQSTDQGTLEVRFVDEEGNQVGSTSISNLSGSQKLDLKVEEGAWSR